MHNIIIITLRRQKKLNVDFKILFDFSVILKVIKDNQKKYIFLRIFVEVGSDPDSFKIKVGPQFWFTPVAGLLFVVEAWMHGNYITL